MIYFITALEQVTHEGRKPEILMAGGGKDAEYNSTRQVFNQRFDHKPACIVLCESKEQVANAVKVAAEYDIPLRVCAGRHDHEGECSSTGAIVVDFRKMKDWKLDKRSEEEVYVHIQPGILFQDLVQKMADEHGRSIPHGTCESVGVAGFTMGGGWGPWTRKHGMCAEYLVAATIVLGDGSIVTATEDNEYKDLLWALRGGGGFSYGIVTEFVIKTFPAPKYAIKFNVVWETSPALKVLERWEQLIDPDFGDGTPKLVGTNLKIDAIPVNALSIEESIHSCTFFGYYVGAADSYAAMCKELESDISEWFKDLRPTTINIPNSNSNDKISFSSWERVSAENKKRAAKGLLQMEFPADIDHPAPHKITCRLVRKEGLGDAGRRSLIESLRSDLISVDTAAAGIHTYVTLGAISGEFYKNYNRLDHPLGSAFPYKDRPYTIQYQCWWNEKKEDQEQGKKYHVYRYVNEAMDWIDHSRQRHFPETLGSFISFKDSSIPTRDYFLQSFDRLRRIKLRYSEDINNIFRSRKTII